MTDRKKSRRQFLKNSSLAALALGTPIIKSNDDTPEANLDEINCNKTTLDLYGEGPFYTENPPVLENNQLASADEPGDRMIISGRVFNLECSEYIPNTLIDVWHADDAGAYDNQGYNLRGQVYSNEQGFYMFETIKPGKYLNGNMFRPSHIHFRIIAPEQSTFITQLYFENDPDLETDAASSVTSGQFDATNRIIALTENADGILEGTWDIVIDGEGVTTGVSDIHLDKGIIYRSGPNPFNDIVNIRYGVYRKAKVSLLVFDMNGRTVAKLEERDLPSGQYDAEWHPDPSLPNGHYFIALKINDLQVHYLKMMKQS